MIAIRPHGTIQAGVLQSRPIGQQLFLVKFRPGLYQAPLAPWEFSGHQFDGIEAEDRHIVLVVRVEVRQVVRRPDLHIHTNDDTKKAAEFRHGTILPRVFGPAILNVPFPLISPFPQSGSTRLRLRPILFCERSTLSTCARIRLPNSTTSFG